MSQVKILVSMAMLAATTGLNAAGIQTTLTDSAGNAQSKFSPVSSFPAPATDGTFQVEVDFDGVPTGSFAGTVTAMDVAPDNPAAAPQTPVSPGVSYSGTATNLQPLPVTVSVAFA
jgi:hypothetical protein